MLRRDGKLFRRGVIPALVLSVLLTAVFAAAGFSVLKSAEADAAPVNVALVDEEDSLISRIAVNMVESQGFIASLLSFDRADEEEALEGISNGTYAAAIILPEGYTDAIMSGESTTGRILLSKAAAANAETVASVARFGERLLSAGQYGVFAGQKLIWEGGLDELTAAYLAESNSELIAFALNSFDTAFIIRPTAYAGTGLTAPAWYALSWLVLLLFISGLFFNELYTADFRTPLLVRLYALGVKPVNFFLGKFLWPLLFRLILSAGLLYGLSRFVPVTVNAGSILYAFTGLVLLSLITSAVCVLLADRGAVGPFLAASAVGLFLCGGLVPRSMLSASLLKLGDFTPFGSTAEAFMPLFGGTVRPYLPAVALAYALLFLFLALRKLKKMSVKGGTP